MQEVLVIATALAVVTVGTLLANVLTYEWSRKRQRDLWMEVRDYEGEMMANSLTAMVGKHAFFHMNDGTSRDAILTAILNDDFEDAQIRVQVFLAEDLDYTPSPPTIIDPANFPPNLNQTAPTANADATYGENPGNWSLARLTRGVRDDQIDTLKKHVEAL